MARKALLIGAQTGGLTGVDNDVTAMAEALRQRGFALTLCQHEQATRDGILAAYDQLIDEADSADAVFVYYSGHGGFIRPPETDESGPSKLDLQFIVPSDFDQSTEEDFRGITSVELSLRLRQLTDRTTNVVVALDCCHAAHMSRDPDMRVKARYHASYARVQTHLNRMVAEGMDTKRWMQTGNPHAVRIVACAPDQSAYEYTNRDNVRTGLLTETLTRALAEAGDLPVTWATLVERMRRRILLLMPSQRPEVEGPSNRLLFELTVADPVNTLPAIPTGTGDVRLDGGRLLGIQVGDEFVVMPADAPGPDDATKLADVLIDRLDSIAAIGKLRLRQPDASLPLGARAHRTKAVAPAIPVRVPHPDPRTADLLAAMANSTFVRRAETDEQPPVEVRVDEVGGLTICDRVEPLHAPRTPDRPGIQLVVKDLERLARASAMRSLTEVPGLALDTSVTIEWGLVEAGKENPLPGSGAVVFVGQRVYIRVRNDGEQTIYVSLLDVGVSAGISVLTALSPSGIALPPKREYVFGLNQLEGLLTGEALSWPEGLESEQGRPETVVALISSDPVDVSVLEQRSIRQVERKGLSSLELVLDQLATGRRRDLTSTAKEPVRYLVRTIDFELRPGKPPTAETVPFLVDDRPGLSTRMASRGDVQRALAVRLDDLVVHRNRAAFGADIRVDTVVLTGGGAAPHEPKYEAHTERFSNIRDGDRLPLDKLLIFHGSAVNYLDIAIWVSRDAKDSLALSDLMQEKLASTEMREAIAAAGILFAAAPQVAIAAAAIGGCAVIVNSAYKLLLGAVGTSIGLYRTSLLAHEQFGVGRHPLRAQDFSLTYTVEDVG